MPGVINSTVTNAGTFNNNAGGLVAGLLTNNAGTTTNSGILAAGAIVFGGTLNNDVSGQILTALTINAGGTAINAGTIDGTVTNVGTTNNVGTINGPVINAGTFNNNIGGLVTGLLQNDAGTTTNTGTLVGGAQILGGALQIGNGGTTGDVIGNINVLNPGVLVFDRSNLFTYGGVISGTGSVQQIGSGTTVLTNINTYNGATIVSAGTLSVNGSIASSSLLTVNAGGTVGGTGVLPSTVIANGGRLAPGNSIGTITVNGNLIFNAGSIYAVEVSPNTADRTNVTGTATLGGTVNAIFAPGSYITHSYTILSAAAGLGGTSFNTLATTNLSPNISTSLSYTSTDVLLNLTAVNLGGGTSLNGNQQSVANAVNGFFNSGGTLPPNFGPLLGLTGSALSNALTQLSGEAATGAQRGAFQLTSQFLDTMLDPFVFGSGGIGRGQALGFAAEREALPQDVTLAYAKAVKAPVSKAPPPALRAALERVGWQLRRL